MVESSPEDFEPIIEYARNFNQNLQLLLALALASQNPLLAVPGPSNKIFLQNLETGEKNLETGEKKKFNCAHAFNIVHLRISFGNK